VSTLYRPQLLYSQPGFTGGAGLLVSPAGSVSATDTSPSDVIVDLPGKALLPGFVNAHSHTFQRLIRGKSESRVTSGRDFWSWRGTMYHAAAQLDPQDVYDVARMAFLEMVLSGTTTVGEFHYLHNALPTCARDMNCHRTRARSGSSSRPRSFSTTWRRSGKSIPLIPPTYASV